MGIIQRQSIKHSIVSYTAVLVGMVSTIFIYTLCFSKSELGFIAFFQDTILLVLGFVMLGAHQISLRFFPQFNNPDNGNNGFLTFLSLLLLAGFSIFLVLTYFFYDAFLARFDEQEAYAAYFPLFIPAIFLVAYWSLFAIYCSNFKRIVVPTIFTNLFKKLAIPALALAYYFGYFGFDSVIYGILVMHACIVLALLAYLKLLGQLHFTSFKAILTPSLKTQIRNFGLVSIIGGLGSVLATRIDKFMVADFLGFENTGIFHIAATIAVVIDVPRTALNSIAAPIISEAWKRNDLVEIQNIYQKTSINQLIAGLLLLIGIWASVDELFVLIPDGATFATGKHVILILGIAKLIDMITSVNSEIIQFSSYYRYNLYAVLLLGVLNILANYILIPTFWINGAALATLLSLSVFNLFKFTFLYYKFNLQPLRWANLWAIVIALVVYGLHLLLPDASHPILTILLHSIFIGSTYVLSILYFNLSPDMTNLVKDLYQKYIDS